MHQCSSMEFHFRNANAPGPDTVIYLLIYLCTYLPVPLCVCLLLIPPFFQSACLLRDLGLPHLPLFAPRTHCACVHSRESKYTLRQKEDEKSQPGARPLRCFSVALLLATVSFRGPVIQPARSGLSTRSISNLHAVSASFRAPGWCDTGSRRK